jgi:tetratricopeptide (TPR) repeat protein
MKSVSALILLTCVQLAFAATPSLLEQIQLMRLAGEYQKAIELGQTELDANSDNALLLNELGELQFETGNLNSAAGFFRQIIDQPGSDKLMAKFNLAEIHRYRGELQLAEILYGEIRASFQTQPQLSARDLYAIAGATRYLGRSDPQLFKEAVRLFDQAIRVDPSFVDAGIALGELLLEKYNNREALDVFKEVLSKNNKHPRALLGLARSQHFDYLSVAMQTTRQALEINPKLVSARVFMSRLYIELEQFSDAKSEAQQALAVNPVSLEALSMLAVIFHLERNAPEFARIEKRVLELNPHYAGFYTSLAELAARNRLYQDALTFAAKAVKLDPLSSRGYGLLGMNQLRLGKIAEGRANLERSFNADPYNIWIKNTLQLADSFTNYVQIDSDRFQIVLHGEENELLVEYIPELAEQAYQLFETRYRHEPGNPIRLEFYPDHADFSVRTVGLAGVGLLGVCFGPVVAMDSPAARRPGAFNWGSTLWHEIAHVFHLSMTANRVPRWFSEGMAVYEERTARPGWGGDVSEGFLLAYLDGQLLPVSQLNNGFVRPSYPQQVIHSYFQASLVFEFIESRWGFDVIRETLNAFGNSTDPDAELLKQLQLESEALDAAFDTYLQNKYATALKALSKEIEPGQQVIPAIIPDQVSSATVLPDKYFAQLKLGGLLLEQGKPKLAEPFLKKAQQLFPEYAGEDSSYWLLATLYLQQGKYEQAEQQLAGLIAINAEHYSAHLQLAKLRAQRSDHAGAAAALEAAIYIFPYELDLHEGLAVHLASQGVWNEVTRERRAVLALGPVDKAEAFYQLAEAYDQAGDRNSAHEQVLYALEIAPNFYRAQELLLSLRGAIPRTSERQ